ncbi:MAG: hypothetical protein ACAH07_02205 [Methylophilaceae bacterium]|nr:hypothetical protein [Methyloradius sp.]
MNKSRIYVDFNEMISDSEVLLSQKDTKVDSNGNEVVFIDGLNVSVYMDDEDENGNRDNLIAEGIAIRNYTNLYPIARWLLKIDTKGIRHESDEIS